jgi:hypothetical protein
MSFPDHFSIDSRSYERFGPTYPEALFDFLESLCRRHRLAWDCATGSAQAALPLVGRFDCVLATDASLAQLAQARPVAGLDLLRCLAAVPALTPRSIDLLTVAQSLHCFDLDRLWPAVRRVAAAGAVVAVWCLPKVTIEPAIDRSVEYHYRRVVGRHWPPERRRVERGYDDLPFPFERLAPPSCEVTDRWGIDRLVGYLSTWSATARYRAAEREDPVPHLARQLAEVWGRPSGRRRVTWPLSLRVGRVE